MNKVTLANIWRDDNKLALIFSWITRVFKLSPFGTIPISYYQQDRCRVIELLERAAAKKNIPLSFVRYNRGIIEMHNDNTWVEIAKQYDILKSINV